ASQIRSHTGFKPSSPHCECNACLLTGMNHWSVTGEPELDLNIIPVLYLNHLALDTHWLPPALVPVLKMVLRVQLVHIELLLVDRKNGETEGNLAVVADADPRQSGLPSTNNVETGGAEVGEIAEPRKCS